MFSICHSVRRPLLAVCLLGSLTGCASRLVHSRTHTPNGAFITYRPPAKGSGRTRLAVKDFIDVQGFVTSDASEYVWKNSAPAKRDAACMAIARQRNVDIVGKANASEFALSLTGINEYFGTPKNPLTRKPYLVTGGSSSGPAVAVAADLADVAFGTDAAGSVRVPAACCGVVGLKTTLGLISMKGVFAVDPKHLDTVGPLGKDIAHTVEGMDLLEEGFAAKYQAAMAEKPSAAGIRIGRLYLNGTDPKIDQAIDDSLRRAGFKVVRLDDNFRAQWAQANTDGTTVAEGSTWIAAHQYFDRPDVSGNSKAALALGNVVYNTTYPAAMQRRRQWQRNLNRVFQHVDFIALPTLQTLPPKVPFLFDTPVFEAAFLASQNTQAFNYSGTPALAVPIPVDDDRIPLTSLQLAGPRLSEAGLLNAGRLVEAARPEVKRATN